MKSLNLFSLYFQTGERRLTSLSRLPCHHPPGRAAYSVLIRGSKKRTTRLPRKKFCCPLSPVASQLSRLPLPRPGNPQPSPRVLDTGRCLSFLLGSVVIGSASARETCIWRVDHAHVSLVHHVARCRVRRLHDGRGASGGSPSASNWRSVSSRCAAKLTTCARMSGYLRSS